MESRRSSITLLWHIWVPFEVALQILGEHSRVLEPGAQDRCALENGMWPKSCRIPKPMAEGPKAIAVAGEQLEESSKKNFRKQGPYAPKKRRWLGDIKLRNSNMRQLGELREPFWKEAPQLQKARSAPSPKNLYNHWRRCWGCFGLQVCHFHSCTSSVGAKTEATAAARCQITCAQAAAGSATGRSEIHCDMMPLPTAKTCKRISNLHGSCPYRTGIRMMKSWTVLPIQPFRVVVWYHPLHYRLYGLFLQIWPSVMLVSFGTLGRKGPNPPEPPQQLVFYQ